MSSFGCKSLLRDAIVSKDLWFSDAEEIVIFLNDFFINDESKDHYLIDEESTASIRSKNQKEHVIYGCRKFHLIAVTPERIFLSWIITKTKNLF